MYRSADPLIYKFKSKAAGDVIMLGPGGDQVLRIIGREPAAKGIIEVAAHAGGDRGARAGDRRRRGVAKRDAERADDDGDDAAAPTRSACGSAPGRWSR